MALEMRESEQAMTPKVSVVIPTYNAAGVIDMAIASVAVQAFADLEVILVDDCSRDDTLQRAEAALQRHGLAYTLLRQTTNLGPAAARNAGIVAARGDYVAFLDADDEWLPGKLTAQVAVLDAEPGVTLCGCQAMWVDESGRNIAPLFRKLPSRLPDGWKRLLWQCYVATPCAMVRRDDLGIRPFDPTLRIGEDRDLWIKLASNGTVALVQREMVRIRLSLGSFMQTNSGLILTCTQPMIDRHLHALGGYLSPRERLLAHGSLKSQIGKTLCSHPERYFEGCRYLLASALMGYRPFDAARELFYRAPGIREMKGFVKRRYMSRAGLID